MAHAAQFVRVVTAAKAKIKETNVAEGKRRSAAAENFTLINVREPTSWMQGHLPGALHLGKGIIERDIEQRAPQTDAKLVLSCGGGFGSALGAESLQKMGYTNVESMDGGWKGWCNAGLPTERGQ